MIVAVTLLKSKDAMPSLSSLFALLLPSISRKSSHWLNVTTKVGGTTVVEH